MNPLTFALRHPITVMALLAGLVVGSGLALWRMRVDVFPTLNLPVIYVCQPYGGMDAAQMEGFITNYYEYHFLYVGGIHHVESRNIQGTALIKVVFHPGTDMAQAMAEVVAAVNRSRALAPAGTLPPFVARFDTGSVPVGYLVLDSDTRSVGEMQDLAVVRVRPIFAGLPGVSTPPPFGGSPRAILVNVDPDKLRGYHLSPDDVINALSAGNTISPAGNVRIGDQMPVVPLNSLVGDPQELGAIPLRPGESVYLRDVARIEDGNDVQAGYALVNGKRSVYMLVTKRAEASTLAVVTEIKRALPRMQDVLPDDVRVRYDFDQSPVVTRAMTGVAVEGLIGAGLTGLMVLLFLRDWRSVIVVVLNIPLALLAAVVALWAAGQTLNLMTLGGLALAVGILVDEATVEVENIHAQMERGPDVARAVRLGNAETAVPRLLAMLCVLAVFIPSFLMDGAVRALFVPLSLAVGFSMVASYFLSSTFVPIVSVWLLKQLPHHSAPPRGPGWYERVVSVVVRLRWLAVPAYFVAAGVVLWLVAPRVGTEIFPTADTGAFAFRLRAPTGTRIEVAEEMTREALKVIDDMAGGDAVESSLAYVGTIPAQYPVQCIYLFTSGPEEAVCRVALKPGIARIEPFKARLRQELPERLRAWYVQRLVKDGVADEMATARAAGIRLALEPADIINEVMSFGSPAAVEVLVSGPKLPESRAFAEKVFAELKKVDGLRDVQVVQATDYPAVAVDLDRERAAQSGVTAADVARSLVAATSSSRFVVPNYWRDPATGIGYQVQVQVPVSRMDSAGEVGLIPVKANAAAGLLVRDVARVSERQVTEEFSRYNMRRYVSIVGNPEGIDLGRLSVAVKAAIAAAGTPPKGVTVDLRGQVEPLGQMVNGLALGLALAVVVILVLLAAYFQSVRLALVAVATVPAVLVGVALMLWLTGTTLNLQSFMGAIMAIGVAVANAILLVTFAERARTAGGSATQAAVVGAAGRLRPIAMTSCAMVAGMLPMALAFGEGGDQSAPLGRAVIGGLLAATAATLFALPAVFAVAQAGAGRASVSLDPDDPDSPLCDAPTAQVERAAERGTIHA